MSLVLIGVAAALMASNRVRFDIIALLVVLALMLSGVLSVGEALAGFGSPVVILVAGLLVVGEMLDRTGVAAAIGDGILFLTAALGLFLSNTASAVLVAPIAIIAAQALGVSPYPFAVAVLIAASAAFVTPVSTPVVTLVVEPGRYGFMDFVKVGVPLLLLTWAVTLLVAPLVFPFSAS